MRSDPMISHIQDMWARHPQPKTRFAMNYATQDASTLRHVVTTILIGGLCLTTVLIVAAIFIS